MPPEHWIVLPTYNEAENIVPVLEAIRQLPQRFAVLVVDDNSPDGTARLALEYRVAYPEFVVEILQRPQKEGLGRAYEAGFWWVLRHTSAQFIYEMDADLSHSPTYLLALAKALEDADMAIGSRYLSGINVVNWPLGRILLSYGASWYVRLITGMPIYDPTAGFVGYRRALLSRILSATPIRFKGYAFQIEMKYKAFLAGARLVEVPIIFTERVAGVSKMSRQVVQEAIWGVLWLRWNKAKLRKKLLAPTKPAEEVSPPAMPPTERG
ncbi:MAG: polyprenol monophosphomannose synthase [Bacteroidia bacterium]